MSDPMAAFVESVSRLPLYQGVAWRAAGFELTAPFNANAPMPATRDLRVATENFTAAGAHLFLCTGARDIALLSVNPREQEVVLLPGARFVPATAFHEVAGVRVQVIIEQPPSPEPIPSIPTDDEITALMQAARSEQAFPITSPGRFGA